MIASLLGTPEGRGQLATAMVQPIRVCLDHMSIGRKLLMAEEIPQGQFAWYEREPTVKSSKVPLIRFMSNLKKGTR